MAAGDDGGDHLDDFGQRALQGSGEAVAAANEPAATLTSTIGGTEP